MFELVRMTYQLSLLRWVTAIKWLTYQIVNLCGISHLLGIVFELVKAVAELFTISRLNKLGAGILIFLVVEIIFDFQMIANTLSPFLTDGIRNTKR